MYSNASFIFGMFVQLSLFWLFQHRSDALLFGLLILVMAAVKFVLDYARQPDNKPQTRILLPDSISVSKAKKVNTPKSLTFQITKHGLTWQWF